MSARYNFIGKDCPVCYREGSLERPAADGGAFYRCSGCWSLFRFEKATDLQVETLVRIPERASVDDIFCLTCKRRGYRDVCPTCEGSDRVAR